MNEYAGWGTALKPAHEPIVMARKPLSEKTIVDNVLKWGTGGINIDDSRVGMTEEDLQKTDRVGTIDKTKNEFFIGYGKGEYKPDPQGRFPANIIFDEEAGKILDEQSGILKSGNLNAGHKRGVGTGNSYANGGGGGIIDRNYGGDEGGASRFFYCPKTSKTDRNEGLEHLEGKQVGTLNANSSDLENYGGSSLGASSLKGDHKPPQPKQNFHPTVKPTDLMLYLIRLVTPKGGTTLDPFMGSGSTGKAAVRGGFDFVGIEREDEYMEIAQTRIQYEQDNPYNEEKGERVEVNKNSNKFW
jgi:site-specific DNA-methyltransferase (adenine-specific)